MKKKWLLAGIVGAAAAAVYFASVVSYAFPGESARLRALWSGLKQKIHVFSLSIIVYYVFVPATSAIR